MVKIVALLKDSYKNKQILKKIHTLYRVYFAEKQRIICIFY